MILLGLVLLPALFTSSGCGRNDDPTSPPSVSDSRLGLLALGDSYTVGHSLPTEWSWPYQLADTLAAAGDSLTSLQVIARTGWTTRDLLDAVRDTLSAEALLDEAPGLVTLMIGVNNQFQDIDLGVFEAEMDTLINLALALAGEPGRVLGFSIPDYGVTPVGEMFGSVRIGVEIEEHNAILERKFGEYGVPMLDITTVSRLADDLPQLVAKDGLHYSAEMYARWVTLMLPAVRSGLELSSTRIPASVVRPLPKIRTVP